MQFKDPVLVEKTSGIGEKLKIAIANRHYSAIGTDLVAMVVNDVVATGAQPIAFLDYIACGKLEVPLVTSIVRGISDGCKSANVALLGRWTIHKCISIIFIYIQFTKVVRLQRCQPFLHMEPTIWPAIMWVFSSTAKSSVEI